MLEYTTLSNEGEALLFEILANESNGDYWKTKFEALQNKRDDAILRGSFQELTDSKMISVSWADNYPFIIRVLRDGYLYEQRQSERKRSLMTPFERELNDLLDRSLKIRPPVSTLSVPSGTERSEYNRPSEDWMNDVEIFYHKYLSSHSLGSRINTLLFQRGADAYHSLVSCLRSISRDKDFMDKMNGIQKITVPAYQARMLPEYDVFLSHASKDKEDIVDELNSSLEKLKIRIFYDKKAIEWGDKWKNRILEGTQKAEFAIIVISENFFDREWTEKELYEFLNRQNRNGQKLILPILHKISREDLGKKYPLVADIQAIDSKEYSCDQIALLFARLLIQRLKGQSET